MIKVIIERNDIRIEINTNTELTEEQKDIVHRLLNMSRLVGIAASPANPPKGLYLTGYVVCCKTDAIKGLRTVTGCSAKEGLRLVEAASIENPVHIILYEHYSQEAAASILTRSGCMWDLR